MAIVLLVIGIVMGAGDFLLGGWLIRLSALPKSDWPAGVRASEPAQLAFLGRALMFGGPVIFCVLAAFAFGLIPAEHIVPIQFR